MRTVLLALLFMMMIVPPAMAREKVLDIKEVTSEKGIKAWLVEDHSVPVIAFQFAFKGLGAALDPAEKQGLSRMASNTMDEGAGDLDSQAFQKELRDKVINLGFTSSRDHFGGTIKTLTKNKDRAFELMKMALTQPRFDAEAIERMRKANESRIRSALTEPDWLAARVQNDIAFAGHPYAQNSGGTLSTLKTITAEDLRAFSKKLARDNLVVAVAGDISQDELRVVLDHVFGDLPERVELPAIPELSLQNSGTIALYKQDIPQTIIEMIQPGISRTHPDFPKAQVMNYILGSSGFGSRLMKEIREKRGLTYGIYSYFVNMDRFSGLSVSTSTKNDSVPEMLALMRTEWDRIKMEPVKPKELEDAKSYLIGSLPLSLTSTDDIAGLLLSLQSDGLPIDYLERREDIIRSTSVDDIERLAKQILDFDKFVTILVGNPTNIHNPLIVDRLPNVE
jgi:zinc protease